MHDKRAFSRLGGILALPIGWWDIWTSPVVKIKFLRASRILLTGLVAAWWFQGSARANSVMSWIPAYGIKDSIEALQTDLGEGRTIAESLDRLALQCWIPVKGALALDSRVSEADVRSLIAVAKQNKLQTLLCVSNAYTDVGGSGFSWDRARMAFGDNRAAFVRQIVEETEKFGFDGVELDIESERDGLNEQDRAAYGAFVVALAGELHSRGKNITLSSFPGRWFGPNSSWWSDWAAVVDGVQSMGYSEVGKNGAQDWDSYRHQVALWIQAGGDPKRFMNGVSVYFKQWKGASTRENLDSLCGVAEATGSGAAIWELYRKAHPQDLDPGWDGSANWSLIQRIKDARSP
ncbi:MAG: glycosyl hydrolase family 18 protein [Terrimicrobiaceae bacterium]